MRIAGSGAQTQAPSAVASSTAELDSRIKFLQQQKNDVSKQMEKIQQSKADAKTKQEQLKPLQEQLQNLDAQIQAAQAEKSRQEARKNEASSKEQEPKDPKQEEDRKNAVLLELSADVKQMKTMAKIKGQTEGQGRVLRSEAALDRLHLNDVGAAKKEAKAADLENSTADLNSQIMKKGKEAQNTVKRQQEKDEAQANGETEEEKEKREREKRIDLQA
ncbi:FlxA-like family protein [Azotosporobacter soli]|uniref:FlxA-like family protein n=1 Tax=Azotosporobacter soli TaxID=3055040 RepID=UPI0031FEA2A4